MKKIISLVVMLTVAASCFNCFAADITAAQKTILYVSPDGNDANDGTEANPLASVLGARNKLREIKNSGGLARDGAVVYLREGEYDISDTVSFEKQDGGTERQPIVYRAYKDDSVTFSGGIYIPYSKFKKTTDNKILNQIIDESARAKVKQINLRNIGYHGKLTYLTDMEREGEYVPEKKLITPIQMYVGDTVMNLSRYPNGTGMMGMQTLVKECQDVDYWLNRKYTHSKFIPESERDPNDPLIFVPDDDRFLLWPEDSGEGVLRGPFGTGWSSNDALFTVDKTRKQISTKYPLMFLESLGPGTTKYYALNFLCELDTEYEYWVDNNANFYCILPDSASEERIFLSTCDNAMFSIEDGCEYLTLRGFDFQKSRGKAVVMNEGSANNLIYACKSANNEGIGVYGKSNGVKNSEFFGKSGVTLYGGDHEKLIAAENYVENSEFDINGADKNGLIIQSAVGNRASYNEIHNGRNVLVSIFGKKNIFEYNDVYDGMQYASDSGLLYGTGMSKGGVCERGNIFRYNYFHDSHSQSAIQAGNCAIYTDDCSAGSLIVGNIISNINNGEGRGIHLGGSSDTIIDNNIFVNLKTGVLFDERASWATVNNPENSIIISNLNVTNHGWFKNEYWRAEFPELYERFKEIDPVTFAEAWNCKKTHNIYWNVEGDMIASSFKYLVNEDNLETKADPGFVDAANGNFMLNDDSPVLSQIDFKQIPVTRIGRYSKRAVERVKDAVVLKDNSPYSYIGGEKKLIGDDESVTPVYVGDSIYIPLRFVSEGLGAQVEWNDETNSASVLTAEGKSVTFTLNSNEAVLDGQPATLENAPILYLDKTYIPIRAFSELAGYKVFWDDCGLICVSTDDRFNPEADGNIITYLADELNIY